MKISLLRHGRAADRETWIGDDDLRPLTKDGAQRCRVLCAHYRHVVDADQIWTSPLPRARATADIAATIWKLPVREVGALAPAAATSDQRIALLQQLGARAPLVVGHEPDCSEWIAALSGGGHCTLRKAGLIILEGDPLRGGMSIHAVFAPRHIFALRASTTSHGKDLP